jgi:hypothetical protein
MLKSKIKFMKKKLLLITTLFLASTVTAQFTSSNVPDVGDNIQLYIVDSSAVNLEAITGAGVIWDYSGLSDYNEATREITVKDPQNTSHSITFNNSTKAIETEGELITFVKEVGNERLSQGVVYNDAEFGNLILTLENDQGLYYSYPFDLGNTITDDISGTATFTYLGQTVNSPAVGKLYASVDGLGTLKLGLNAEYNDVLRYKLVDTMRLATILGEYLVIHKQFEYYDHTVSNLPIFTHSYLWFGPTGGPPRNEFTFVLSKDIITSSITEETLAEAKVYPNPANDIVNVELPNGVNDAEISIVDALGREILKTSINSAFTNLSVSHLEKGTYFVKIAADNIVATKTLILQ